MAKLGDFRWELIAIDKVSPATTAARQSTEKLRQSTAGLSRSYTGLASTAKKALPYLGGAAIVAAMARFASSIFHTAVAFEKMEFQLRGVSKTAQEADAQFKMIREFAAKTPFMTEDVTQAFIKLKAVGLAPTLQMMGTMGDAAFAMGQNLDYVSSAVINPQTEVLRRLGIMLDQTGDKAVIMSGDMRVMVEKDLIAIRKAIVDVWEKRFGGAMKKAEETTVGAVALMASEWAEFKDQLGTFVLPEVKMYVGWMTKAIEKAREWAGMFVGESSFKKQIEADRLERQRLQEELERGIAMPGPEGIEIFSPVSAKRAEEIKARIADLNAEIRLYTQHLEHTSDVTPKVNETQKNFANSAGDTAEKEKALRVEMMKTADTLQRLQDMYQRRVDQWVSSLGIAETMADIEERRNENLQAQLDLQSQIHPELELYPGGEGTTDNLEDIKEKAEGVAGTISSGIAGALVGATMSGQKFGEAMKGVFKSLVREAIAYIAKLLIIKAIKSALGGFHTGGFVGSMGGSGAGMESWGYMHTGGIAGQLRKAHTGLLAGGGNEFPVLVKPGEYIVSRKGVQAAGVPALEEINKGNVNVGGIVMTNSFNVTNMADVEELGEALGESIISALREA